MSSLIQLRRDTTSNWASINPILAQGEVGIDMTANKLKVGNGVDTWSNLPWLEGSLPSSMSLLDLGIPDGVSGQVLTASGNGTFSFTSPVADLSQLTDTTGVIPTDISELTDTTGLLLNPAIPTNVSAFANDAGYLTSVTAAGNPTDVQMNVGGALAPTTGMTYDVDQRKLIATNIEVAGKVSGHLIPENNIQQDLGSPTKRWKDLYLSTNTIYFGNHALGVDADGDLVFNGLKLASASDIAELVAEAPQMMDTLKELSDAIGGDANFFQTMTDGLASKADMTALDALITQLSAVATTGSYDDLSNRPDLSTFATDAELAAVQTQFGSLMPVATTGDYADLLNKPDLSLYATTAEIADVQSQVGLLTGSLATVATTGSYDDLTNRPDLSTFATDAELTAVQAQIANVGDNLADVATTGSYTDLSNRPDLSFYASYADYSALETRVDTLETVVGNVNGSLATVATTGDYNDLTNKPDLSTFATTSYVDTAVAGLVNSAPGTLDTLNELAAALGNDANFASTITNQLTTIQNDLTSLETSTFSGDYNDLTNKPTLFSGSYNDLTDTPSSAGALVELSDVSVTAPVANDVLTYNGTAWVASPAPDLSIYQQKPVTSYKGYKVSFGRMFADEPSLNKLVIYEDTVETPSVTMDLSNEDDLFSVSGLDATSMVAMFVIMGADSSMPISLETLKTFSQAVIDSVILSGGVEGSVNTIDDMKAAFYAEHSNLASIAGDLYQNFQFFTTGNQQYFSNVPYTVTNSSYADPIYMSLRFQGNGYVFDGYGFAVSNPDPGTEFLVLGSDLGGVSPDNDCTIRWTGSDLIIVSGTSVGTTEWPTNSIDDGGNDQYDGGNYISTNLASDISYNGGEIVVNSDNEFGPGSSYVVVYQDSIFGLFATNVAISQIKTDGGSGFDGNGTADFGSVFGGDANGVSLGSFTLGSGVITSSTDTISIQAQEDLYLDALGDDVIVRAEDDFRVRTGYKFGEDSYQSELRFTNGGSLLINDNANGAFNTELSHYTFGEGQMMTELRVTDYFKVLNNLTGLSWDFMNSGDFRIPNGATIRDNDGNDLLAAGSFSGDYNDLTNKPDLSGYATAVDIINIDTRLDSLESTTFSGDYNDLLNKPTIPTSTSQLTNDSGFITLSDVPAGFSGNYNDLTNKPDLSTYATTSYVDTAVAGLVNSAPGALDTLKELSDALGGDANFATTITNQLTTIQNDITTLQSGTGASVTVSTTAPTSPATGDLWYDETDGRTYVYNASAWVDASPAVTGFSGNYDDLTNKPDLSTYATTTYVDDAVAGVTGFSGDYADLTNKPDLSTYATTTYVNTAVAGVTQYYIPKTNVISQEVQYREWDYSLGGTSPLISVTTRANGSALVAGDILQVLQYNGVANKAAAVPMTFYYSYDSSYTLKWNRMATTDTNDALFAANFKTPFNNRTTATSISFKNAVQQLTVSSARAFSVIDVPASGTVGTTTVILVVSNGAGSFITWPSGTMWPEGDAPTLGNGTHVISMMTYDGGTSILATALTNYA